MRNERTCLAQLASPLKNIVRARFLRSRVFSLPITYDQKHFAGHYCSVQQRDRVPCEALSFSLELLFDSVEMKERENSVWIPSNNSVLLLDCRRAASSIPSNERCIGTQTYFTRNGSADLSHSLARRRKQVGPVVFRVCSRRRWSNPNRTIAVRFSDAWIDFRRRITARYVDALLKIISLPTNISPNAINGLPTTNPFAIPAGRHGIDIRTRATDRATSYCQVFIRR